MKWTPTVRAPRAVLGCVAACVLLWALPGVLLHGYARGGATTSALTVSMAAAAALAAVRAGASRGRERMGWALVAASSGAWAAGELIWTFAAWREIALPVPSVADPFFAISGPLLLGGIVVLALRRTALAGRFLVALDGAIVALSVLVAFWQFVVATTPAGSRSALATGVNATYLASDVAAFVTGLLVLGRTYGRGRSRLRGDPLPLLAAAAAATGVGDVLYSQVLYAGSYSLGHPVELSYALRAACLVAVALLPAATDPVRGTVPGRVTLLAPYVAALIGVGSVIRQAVVGDVDTPTLGVVAAIMLLVVSRQILTVLEHTALTRELESRVASRTSDLTRQQDFFRTVLDHAADIVTAVDADGIVIWHSEREQAPIFGEPIGTPLFDIVLPSYAPEMSRALAEAAEAPGSVSRVTWSFDDASGARHFETLVTSLLDEPAVGALVLTSRDVTERDRLERRIAHQAFHDELTQLPNRNLYRDRLGHSLAARTRDGQMVGVLFLGLDGFKSVNDTLGHRAGDELLREVAVRLQTTVRPGDTVARLGGDEFAVLLDRVSDEVEAEAVARRVLASLSAPATIAGKELVLKVSLGYAVTSTGDETSDELHRNADLALNHAKSRRGEGPRPYLPSMHEEMLARVRTEEGLRTALAQQELRLHYQPTVDLATGRMTGVEALVRWQRPSGLVPPNDFIPVAEESGLIVPIGAWVLREACRQAAHWLRGGSIPITMSVNVSGRQLSPHLVETVAVALAETGFPAELLVLELTESVLVADGEATIELLHKLKALGVRLAIDDFGTGYSSLSYLARLPVDVIKVDRKFVNDLTGGDENADLARAIVEMAHTLRLRTTAEGIETHEQLAELQRLGCDLGQGFLFSRPVPAEAIDAIRAAATPARPSFAVR